MTMLELVKKYGKNKGEDVMWASVEVISKALEEHLNKEELDTLKKKMYYSMVGGHYDKDFADKQIAQMYYTSEDGMKHYAPYWSEDEVRQVYNEVRGNIGNYNFYDFEVALNMIKSDNYTLIKRWFPNDTKEDCTRRFIALTVNWLNDADNPYGDEKVWGYFNKK